MTILEQTPFPGPRSPVPAAGSAREARQEVNVDDPPKAGAFGPREAYEASSMLPPAAVPGPPQIPTPVSPMVPTMFAKPVATLSGATPPPSSVSPDPFSAVRAVGQPSAGPQFALVPDRDDTALFQDARAGFSHLLPGKPALGMPGLRANDPPADAVVHLQDAPITLRYRFEPPAVAAPSAMDLARRTGERYAGFRARAEVSVDFANPTWLAVWSVEAAAVAAYDVAGPPGTARLREDLFVLVRDAMVMLVTWTYPRGFIDDPAYATFASIAEATMVWDRNRWGQTGRVWPDSAFLGPGLYGAPNPKHNEAAKQLAVAPIGDEERAHLMSILAGVVSGAGAPWVPLAPPVREAHRRLLVGAVRDARVRAFVSSAFDHVVTAHDLRGLAMMLGRTLEARRGSSTPLPVVRPPPQRSR
jgi:hypothetical protein